MNNIKTKQYSQAIYDIAKEENLIENYLNLSLAIIHIANYNMSLFSYLGHQSVSKDEKKKLIKEICEGNEYYQNWLFLLVDSGLSKHLRLYINNFIDIYNNEHGIEKGIAWTTEPCSPEMLKKLEEKLTNKLNKKIMLKNKINKELIGGIKLEVGDNVWDNTIKNKLLQLLKEGSKK